jgi:hypothetical protein
MVVLYWVVHDLQLLKGGDIMEKNKKVWKTPEIQNFGKVVDLTEIDKSVGSPTDGVIFCFQGGSIALSSCGACPL